MKKNVTIKDNRIFRRMYSKGRSAVTPFMVVYCRPNGRRHNRLGVTVSTKLGSAVVRNRARRRLREIYRLAQPGMKQGYDVVLVPGLRTGPTTASAPRSSAPAGNWASRFRRWKRDETNPFGGHPVLPEVHLSGPSAPVPLYPHLFPVRPGGH